MKATERQRQLCKDIALEIECYVYSNDIKSPSHNTIIDDFINSDLDHFKLSDLDKEQISCAIAMIQRVIMNNP